MLAWRLAKRAYPPLDGEGARRAGGRWNSPGRAVIYCSEHLSLAVLELLVHVSPLDLPEDMTAHAIELSDDAVRRLDERSLQAVEESDWSRTRTRGLGDRWLDEGRSLALAVPSVIVRRELNILLNPAHPAAADLIVPHSEPFRFDPRLGS